MPGKRRERHVLGTVEAAEAVLRDLYVDLRERLLLWALVTHQTPQPRMGYIGQHLTSVVTGHPGGRSGARGKDLLLPDDKHAEIKTCYRVDQLGKCLTCGQVVASIEELCPACRSTAIKRNDDSKWLLGVKDEDELAALFEAEWLYLVLFDFADLADPREINARIWEVDPRSIGFASCMVDYYFNIRSESRSKTPAPFNLWPFSLKFDLLGGSLVYWAVIASDGVIRTDLFRGIIGDPELIQPLPLYTYAGARNLTLDAIRLAARELDMALPPSSAKRDLLEAMEAQRQQRSLPPDQVAHALTVGLYGPRIASYAAHLPAHTGSAP